MSKHKLTPEEMKQIAHFISQRSIVHIANLQIRESTDKYLESYNQIMDKLEEYNSTN